MATNQLTWKEHEDDKLVPDESEWHDVDFEFTKTHPDWGMDDNVKAYFQKAQERKAVPKMRFPDDTDKYTDRYRLIKSSARKSVERESSSQYDSHPTKYTIEKTAANATSKATSKVPPPELA